MRSANFWGQLIRDIRVEHGFSQRGLSRLAGVNRCTLRRFEQGAGSYMSIYTVEALLAVMGYELEAIRRPDPEDQ